MCLFYQKGWYIYVSWFVKLVDYFILLLPFPSYCIHLASQYSSLSCLQIDILCLFTSAIVVCFPCNSSTTIFFRFSPYWVIKIDKSQYKKKKKHLASFYLSVHHHTNEMRQIVSNQVKTFKELGINIIEILDISCPRNYKAIITLNTPQSCVSIVF